MTVCGRFYRYRLKFIRYRWISEIYIIQNLDFTTKTLMANSTHVFKNLKTWRWFCRVYWSEACLAVVVIMVLYRCLLVDFPSSVWRLVTNPVYIVTCFGICCEVSIVSGFVVFLPKYFETEFGATKSAANLLTGKCMCRPTLPCYAHVYFHLYCLPVSGVLMIRPSHSGLRGYGLDLTCPFRFHIPGSDLVQVMFL